MGIKGKKKGKLKNAGATQAIGISVPVCKWLTEKSHSNVVSILTSFGKISTGDRKELTGVSFDSHHAEMN